MKRLILLLALLLCPFPAMAVQTFLPSAYSLGPQTETKLSDLNTSFTVSDVNEGFFVLVTLEVTNTSSSQGGHLTMRVHETTDAIADQQDIILIPKQTTQRVQLGFDTTGAALGLGSRTFSVYVTKDISSAFIFQPASYLAIYGQTIPAGTIVSLDGLTASVQDFVASNNCTEPTFSTIDSNTHQMCVPVEGNASDTICLGQGCVAGLASFSSCVGDAASCSVGNAVCIGTQCNPAANSGCIGVQCETESSGQISIGGTTPLTEMCLGAKGCQHTFVSSLGVDIKIHPTDSEITNNDPGLGMILRGGAGTGTGDSGNLYLDYCPDEASGTTAQTCAHAWLIKGPEGIFRPWSDDTFDIGDATHRVNAVYAVNQISDEIEIQSQLIPDANNGADIGLLAERFNNGYFNNLFATTEVQSASGNFTQMETDNLTPSTPGSSVIGADGSQFNAAYLDRIVLQEVVSDPCGGLTAGTRICAYMKGDLYVLKFNDGGTVRWKYLDMTGTGVTWVAVTSAP